MIRTITPYTLDELQYVLGRSAGNLIVYYRLVNAGYRAAEYFAEVVWDEAAIGYTLEGHGIGSNRVHILNREALIDRIIADNGRFNRGNAFQIEMPDA